MTVECGKKVTNFKFLATSTTKGELQDMLGQSVVLYFYPKDSTPGCTAESKDFGILYDSFTQTGCKVFGISRDNMKSHERFKEKYNMPFELIADENEEICQLFDVMKTKKMFGKTVRGIQRSTFFIDKNGVLQKQWRKVSVSGHVEEVLEFANSFVSNKIT
ncbi:MAG: peroxiredoxin [Thiotrichales bacterium]|nr:MAG: peroxiredoxin [Thiotrichales bacterium]